MLVGFPPFNDDSVDAIFSNILERKIIWPDEDQRLSPHVEDLINRLLEIDPAKRMGWQELIMHPFFKEHEIEWDTLLGSLYIDISHNLFRSACRIYIIF